MSPEFAIGIDFGTSKSCISYCALDSHGNRPPQAFRLTQDSEFLPSYIYIDGDDNNKRYRYGGDAYNRFLETGDNTRFFSEFKLDLCENHFTEKYQRFGLKPEDLVTLYLHHLKETYESLPSPEPRRMRYATITYPAQWEEPIKNKMILASIAAGLEAPESIKEPSAALVHVNYRKPLADIEGRYVLMIDYGGGTCDVAVCQIPRGIWTTAPKVVKEKTGFGIGGHEIDRAIARDFMNRALEHWKLKWSETDPRRMKLLARYKLKAENAKFLYVSWFQKRNRFDNPCEVMHLTNPEKPGDELSIDLTHEYLDAIIRPIVQKVRTPIERALTDSGVSTKDIAYVYLVGGTSLLPQVEEEVQKILPDAIIEIQSEYARTAVAFGAALWQSYRIFNNDQMPVQFTRGSTLSLQYIKRNFFSSLSTSQPVNKQVLGLRPLVLEGSSIRDSRGEKKIVMYTTEENRSDVQIVIVESTEEEGTKVPYQTQLIFSEPLPARTKIEIIYYVDYGDRLHVEGKAFVVRPNKPKSILEAKVLANYVIDRDQIQGILARTGIKQEETDEY